LVPQTFANYLQSWIPGIELEKRAIRCERKKAVWLRCFSFAARLFGLFHHIFGTRSRFDESTGEVVSVIRASAGCVTPVLLLMGRLDPFGQMHAFAFGVRLPRILGPPLHRLTPLALIAT
jgi:hypothetical protein